MRRKRLIMVALAAALALLAGSVLITGALAWHSARDIAGSQLHELATEVMRFSEATGAQRAAAFARVNQNEPADLCAPEHIRRMRAATADADFLQGMGVIKGNRLQCITMADLHAPVDLGPPVRVSPTGMRSWSSMHLAAIPGARFNINALGHYASLSIPGLAVDVIPANSPLSAAQVGVAGPKPVLIRNRGRFDPEWLNGYRGQDETVMRSGYLLSIVASANGQTATLAAMPEATLMALKRERLLHMAPVAAVVSLSLLLSIGLLLQRRLSLRGTIAAGLNRDEFFVVYQPVVNLSDGHFIGAEALVRWNHEGQLISPLTFIPIAEQSPLICRITDKVLKIVANDAGKLVKRYPDAHIAINFSARDIEKPRIPPQLLELIEQAGISARNIVVEVTEHGLLKPDSAAEILASARALGFRIAVDDFGTGHSSLSYLAHYELDFLKIDRSFVAMLDAGGPAAALVFHIIGMAKSLGLQMIAEGVETEDQRRMLQEAGVQYAQGWLFAKPMPIDALLEFAEAA